MYIYIYIQTGIGLSLQSDVVSGQSQSAIGPNVDGQHVLSMRFFFYMFDGWSIVKFTGSMLFLDTFLRRFRWMVDREVDWPVWVVKFMHLCR